MSRYHTSEQVREVVRKMIAYGTTQKDIALRFEISTGYLCDFLAGNRGPGPKILKALGYEIEPIYRKVAVPQEKVKPHA